VKNTRKKKKLQDGNEKKMERKKERIKEKLNYRITDLIRNCLKFLLTIERNESDKSKEIFY